MTAAPHEQHHKVPKSVKERRRAFVERYPCGYCLALPGAPCYFGRGHEGGSAHGESYHVARYKKAAGAAIDQLLTIEGVRYDEEGAIDEAETRKSEPDRRPHLADGYKP